MEMSREMRIRFWHSFTVLFTMQGAPGITTAPRSAWTGGGTKAKPEVHAVGRRSMRAACGSPTDRQ